MQISIDHIVTFVITWLPIILLLCTKQQNVLCRNNFCLCTVTYTVIAEPAYIAFMQSQWQLIALQPLTLVKPCRCNTCRHSSYQNYICSQKIHRKLAVIAAQIVPGVNVCQKLKSVEQTAEGIEGREKRTKNNQMAHSLSIRQDKDVMILKGDENVILNNNHEELEVEACSQVDSQDKVYRKNEDCYAVEQNYKRQEEESDSVATQSMQQAERCTTLGTVAAVVVLTREKGRNDELRKELEQRQVQRIVELPCRQTVLHRHVLNKGRKRVIQQLRARGNLDYILLTSPMAAEVFASCLVSIAGTIRKQMMKNNQNKNNNPSNITKITTTTTTNNHSNKKTKNNKYKRQILGKTSQPVPILWIPRLAVVGNATATALRRSLARFTGLQPATSIEPMLQMPISIFISSKPNSASLASELPSANRGRHPTRVLWCASCVAPNTIMHLLQRRQLFLSQEDTTVSKINNSSICSNNSSRYGINKESSITANRQKASSISNRRDITSSTRRNGFIGSSNSSSNSSNVGKHGCQRSLFSLHFDVRRENIYSCCSVSWTARQRGLAAELIQPISAIDHNTVVVWTVSSPETLRSLCSLANLSSSATIVCIGNTTLRFARSLGFKNIFTAASPSAYHFADAISQAISQFSSTNSTQRESYIIPTTTTTTTVAAVHLKT